MGGKGAAACPAHSNHAPIHIVLIQVHSMGNATTQGFLRDLQTSFSRMSGANTRRLQDNICALAQKEGAPMTGASLQENNFWKKKFLKAF